MKRTHAGRPPIDDDDPSVQTCVSLPSKQFEAYRKQAAQEDVSIPEIIRRELHYEPPPRRIKI